MGFSVLLSVYCKDNPVYFDQAMKSVWSSQTLKPSQIVIVQDGGLPTELESVVRKWESVLGDFLTIVRLPENVGLGVALNAGLKECRYELVARMDSDDIAVADRFERQVYFMRSHPEVSASSATVEEWSEDMSRQIGQRLLPTNPEQLKKFAQVRSPLSHPASIFRKSHVLAVGGYPSLRKAQDYGLWSLLLAKGYKLSNVPDVLLKMRTGDGLIERRGWEYFKQEAKLLKYQKDIGFLSRHAYLRNLFLKGVLRLSPDVVKRLAYRHAR